MFAEVDPPPFVHVSRPNRSLGPVARRWALGAIAFTTLGVAAGAAAFGAWPVMPFAGLEVALLVVAFRLVARHDADFERLEIGEHEVRVEALDASTHTRFVAPRAGGSIQFASLPRRRVATRSTCIGTNSIRVTVPPTAPAEKAVAISRRMATALGPLASGG